MMFGVIFRVIGSYFEENRFLSDFLLNRFWQKSVDKPLGILVKISNLLKLSI